MTVFDHVPMGEKGLEGVYRWIDGFVEEHRRIAHKEILGKSPDGWDIPAVFVTNGDVPVTMKKAGVLDVTIKHPARKKA